MKTKGYKFTVPKEALWRETLTVNGKIVSDKVVKRDIPNMKTKNNLADEGETLSLCKSCNCMTKTGRFGECLKCHKYKLLKESDENKKRA